MVLFKRKPVQFIPRPTIEDDNAECWIIPETQELFTGYEAYLQRMDWYKARKFICEISGHSGLSFFDALKSETAGARDVDSAFPEALKQPVLRKIQFSTVSRIDNLVDQVYDGFKGDYYPGEQVIVAKGGERHNGTIRDKATFPEIRDPDTGEITREAFARYRIKADDADAVEPEILADDVDVSRDRKAFTKQMLRSFIKNTVTREAWTGAPWLVKQDVAQLYHIDTNVPPHLQYSHKVAEKKEKKKAEQQQDGMFGVWSSSKLPELKPAQKGGLKQSQMTQEQFDQLQQAQWEEYYRQNHMDPAYAQQWHPQQSPTVGHPPNGFPHPHPHAHYPIPEGHHAPFPPPPPHMIPKQMQKPPPPPPPPVIKYPIEDMDCPPQRDGVQRPPLKFVVQSQASEKEDSGDLIPGLQQGKVSLLLETWNTLNVYCQELKLDSFTFDDFVEAMQWSSTEIECELLVEVHCAMLKMLVNSEKDANGAIQISLPDLPEPEDSDEEEDEQEESHVSSPTPEPDVPARRTRSSLNRMALAEQERENSMVESEKSEQVTHRAAELFTEEYGWVARLRKRDFRQGGWQLILVGLLHQLAGRPRLTQSCNRILTHLAPLDADPTVETVVFQYSTMDINLRAEALQLLCQLFLETKAVKKFLEEMSATMTHYRKKKIDHQRARKEAYATLRKLHDERKILAPMEMSPEPVEELEELPDAEKLVEGDTEEIVDSEDERPMTTRSLRRGNDRANERKRKRDEEAEKAEKRKKEAEEKASKGSKEYQRILKAIQKENEKVAIEQEQIDIVDGDLREADAYRTRCLGKDRFCNRYWWFERNAMPYGGLPDSSTADAEYANGRLWVQGPDDMERLGYIDVAPEASNNYFRCFQMTPAERKALEEGPTNLHYATQWGFYDDVESIDKLLDWLDIRGLRELKLRKELTAQRNVMATCMANRQRYIHPEQAAADANGNTNGNGTATPTTDEEADDEKIVTATTRMSTRTKTHSNNIEELEKVHRCLRWKNTTALHELGHRHVDPPPAPVSKKGKAQVKRPSGLSEVVNASERASAPRERRSGAGAGGRKSEEPVLNRRGQPVTRQGGRYNF
ncbi:hypothetical protein PMZ80_000332 [Knufia obscura]|uniref:DDT domain-containing protein n=1 Tax=Knufia obscura TaxID=1635080 RepID=A0ABR0S043_9EURO|nr:hypothetical protein PMZ80_000332 [Knufia obscura]